MTLEMDIARVFIDHFNALDDVPSLDAVQYEDGQVTLVFDGDPDIDVAEHATTALATEQGQTVRPRVGSVIAYDASGEELQTIGHVTLG